MDLNLSGKKALVIGASSGLGLAAASALAAENVELVIVSRSESNLVKAAEQIEKQTSIKAQTITADISTAEGRAKIKSEATAVDILVSNGGGPPPGKFLDHDQSVWDNAADLVLNSARELSQYFLPYMREQKWGRLIFITSIGVLQPVDDLILSNTYRAAVTALCKTISNNYAIDGITANCVCPGFTATSRLTQLIKSRAGLDKVDPEIIEAQFKAMIPAKRLGQPEELAALITFLASDKAAYITGTSIPVDGGYVKSLLS